MNTPEPNALDPAHPAPISSGHWRRRLIIIAGLIACVLVVVLLMWARGTRQSAVRMTTHNRLRLVTQAAQIYQQDTGAAPTLDALLAAGLIDAASLREFSRVQPVAATSNGVVPPILVQTVPCRAVRKGEAWGGPGDKLDNDLPAKRFLLMPDWTVAGMDEPDFQRDWAGKLQLSPLK